MRKLLFALLICSAARAQERFGTIVFPNSSKAEAQAAFLRGVLLLHNFAYPQAERAFVEAQKIDPKFALAYWGEAMTHNHPIWHEVDVEAGRRVLQNLGPLKPSATARERGYIDAIEALYGQGDKAARDHAYEAAMKRLARANPDDVEAHVFWALSILGTRARGESDPRTAIQAAAILEELFPTHPDHPGVLHYLIHAYDDPVHAPLGLRAARRYANVASSAPHALHMPSHIFVQLGMWDDAARSNEAAYALSKEWGKPDMHNLEWLEYAYLQLHRYADARRLIAEANSVDHAHENMQIRYALETGEWSGFEFSTPFGRGMRAIAEKRFNDAQKAIDAASGDVQRFELMALLASARGNTASALRNAELAVAAEEKLGMPSGPPEDFKPAHELYGELLLQSGRFKEALEQFQASLLRTPNRAMSMAGAARAQQAPAVRSSMEFAVAILLKFLHQPRTRLAVGHAPTRAFIETPSHRADDLSARRHSFTKLR